MKITLFLSMPENSDGQIDTFISPETAQKIVDFAFEKSCNEQRIEFEFSGEEPLSRLDLITSVAKLIISHPLYSSFDVRMTVVSNGIVFNDEIIAFINKYNIAYKVNIGTIPAVVGSENDCKNESFTASQIEENIKNALVKMPVVLVSAAFSPSSYMYLTDCVRYFSELGVRHQFYYPDFSCEWSMEDIDAFKKSYEELTALYLNFHKFDNPHYINLIDEKIPLILNGGSSKEEQAYVFSPQGVAFPDARLVGNGFENEHALGFVDDISAVINSKPENKRSYNDDACFDCGVADYCTNCSGVLNSINTNGPDAVRNIHCILEKAAIESAMNVLTYLDALDPFTFIEHYNGSALLQL